jgi:hypothetical protein
MSNGKGSRQRSTDKRKYADGWDRVFGKGPNENTGSDDVRFARLRTQIEQPSGLEMEKQDSPGPERDWPVLL